MSFEYKCLLMCKHVVVTRTQLAGVGKEVDECRPTTKQSAEVLTCRIGT